MERLVEFSKNEAIRLSLARSKAFGYLREKKSRNVVPHERQYVFFMSQVGIEIVVSMTE
jgi:hypothetical protein